MSKKRNKKNSDISKRRKIEEHQEIQGGRVVGNLGPIFYSDPEDLKSEGENQEEHEEEGIAKGETVHSNNDGFLPLYVLDPQDVDDLSVADLVEIWADKKQYCGSREVAAEVLAVLEVVWGYSSYYQGWQTYIERSEITTLGLPLLTRGPETSYINSIENNALSLHDVSKLDSNGLKNAWNNRPDSFASIEAACKTLALLREERGQRKSDTWQELINHDEIEKIKDEVPYEGSSWVISKYEHNRESVKSLSVDERRRHMSASVVREGQQYFRKRVLENYNHICCISGSKIEQILEAAHIVPYTGLYSNRIDNGLCLRVDIHRLFDKFLISINPSTNQVQLSKGVDSDSGYASLNGKELMCGITRPSKYYLEQHFRTFRKRETASG